MSRDGEQDVMRAEYDFFEWRSWEAPRRLSPRNEFWFCWNLMSPKFSRIPPRSTLRSEHWSKIARDHASKPTDR